ncbi:MAG TPA: CinA family protein [Burkholderiales bacterium]|nr:CinA family protein [Burkholderiales bacterium]
MESLVTLGTAVGTLLKARKQTLAVAESSAGGVINAALVAVPGASAYYLGGAIVYTKAARKALLGIDAEDMIDIRSASESYAALLARRVRINLGATWGLSETGASGPTGNRYGDAAGHACIAVSGPVDAVITLETGNVDREQNMWLFARRALALLEACVRKA